jgi:hypothetical protein
MRHQWTVKCLVDVYLNCGIMYLFSRTFPTRETREGWPLLTIESEANGDLWSANERGPSLAGRLGSSCWYKRFYPALAALVSTVKNIFPQRTLFHLMCPLGRQSCQVTCLKVFSVKKVLSGTVKKKFPHIFESFEGIGCKVIYNFAPEPF